jgi:hypothetical protein
MLTYLYLDYGGLSKFRQELKYSLISLKAELGAKEATSQAAIAIYTDSPQAYRNWPVTVVAIAGQIAPWSGGGLYYHRIKPAVVADALGRFSGPVCFLDADSIIRPGFHAEVTQKMALDSKEEGAVVMNVFEKKNPYPPLSGFRCRLPHLGDYRYDVGESLMYNSGLIGVRPEHAPVLEDTLAMIDALIGRAKKFPAIEQFALSEVLRLNRIAIAEVSQTFLHYWQGRRRIYMAGQIAKNLSPDWDDLTPPKEWASMNYWAIRAYNYYYGVTHPLEYFR